MILLKKILKSTLILSVLVVNGAYAEEKTELDFYGWLNFEYGQSSDDEFIAESQGGDRLGAQQSAFGVKAGKGKYFAVITLGGDNLSNGDGDGGNYAIRDSFVVYDNKKDGNFKISAGAQPILFGLKPNGFPGDRSIRAGVEYGGAGGYNVGFQGLTSVKFDYFIKDFEINAIVFDTNEVDAEEGDEGSTINDNNVFQVRYKSKYGVYASAGVENRYMGATGESKPINSVGLGYMHKKFDISAEQITLDEQFTGTDGNETYMIVELTGHVTDKISLYADQATGAEAEISTTRLGAKYALDTHSTLQLEHSKDLRNDEDETEPESIDVRWQVRF